MRTGGDILLHVAANPLRTRRLCGGAVRTRSRRRQISRLNPLRFLDWGGLVWVFQSWKRSRISESSLEPLRLMRLRHTAGCSQEHLGGAGRQRTGPARPGGLTNPVPHSPESCRGQYKLAHSPVLVPGVCESSDEDELDEDEGKSTHDAHVVPG